MRFHENAFLFCRGRRGAERRMLTGKGSRQNGFTLMELLIVMAIIAILMLIAIPTVGSLKKKANDLSASSRCGPSTRRRFNTSQPTRRTGSLARCGSGGEPSAGAPSAAGAQILQGDLTSGFKSGYIFASPARTRSP